jgi:hypothetical protein
MAGKPSDAKKRSWLDLAAIDATQFAGARLATVSDCVGRGISCG